MGSGQELLDSAARNLKTILALTIAMGRGKARSVSHETLLGELKAATPEDEEWLYDLRRTSSEEEDDSHAALIALSFATYWLISATKTLADNQSAHRAIAAANTSQAYRVNMLAATETSTAFNLERSEALKAAARRGPTIRRAVRAADELQDAAVRATARTPTSERLVLFKVWNADMDKRTCDECAEAHGTMVPAGDDFPQGTPGLVHPNCRCGIELVLLPWWQALAA